MITISIYIFTRETPDYNGATRIDPNFAQTRKVPYLAKQQVAQLKPRGGGGQITTLIFGIRDKNRRLTKRRPALTSGVFLPENSAGHPAAFAT